MKMLIELDIYADIDEENMTDREKFDFLENILHYGCQACNTDYNINFLKFKE